ncbi:TIGR03086 family metal-binding protein [Catellatospora bangladeshensis]|uniref:TIGR03086 family metal-binding protein n=1 Tax=Catellatospora bangladeshensis TaxID=310355 RepID=UPI003614E339
MTTISNLLRASADRAAPVLAAIRDEQLGAPTPCAEYGVGDLINHLFQVVDNFEGLARKEPTDWSGTPDVLGTDWRVRFAAETDALVAAWTPESALEGVSVNMGLPQLTIGRMVLLDLVLHPWDLAVATGQEFTPTRMPSPSCTRSPTTSGTCRGRWACSGRRCRSRPMPTRSPACSAVPVAIHDGVLTPLLGTDGTDAARGNR